MRTTGQLGFGTVATVVTNSDPRWWFQMSEAYSRADLEAMERDELVDAITTLQDDIADAKRTASLAFEAADVLEESVFGEAGSAYGSTQFEQQGAVLEQLQSLQQQVDELQAENQKLRDEIETMKTDVAGQKTSIDTSTKKGLARQIARDEVIRRSTKGIRGGAIDYPDVRDLADRDHGIHLNSGTVYAAFEELEDDWTAMNVKDGEDGPHTPNEQLRCDREKISPALRAASDGAVTNESCLEG